MAGDRAWIGRQSWLVVWVGVAFVLFLLGYVIVMVLGDRVPEPVGVALTQILVGLFAILLVTGGYAGSDRPIPSAVGSDSLRLLSLTLMMVVLSLLLGVESWSEVALIGLGLAALPSIGWMVGRLVRGRQ